MLEWRPREFWESTPIELGAALAARIRASTPPGARAARNEIGDDGVLLAPGCTRAGSARVLAEMRAEKEGT